METLATAPDEHDPTTWFLANAPSLTAQEEEFLTLLSLIEPVSITTLTELATRAGIRETPSRAFSTAKLRPILDSLTDRGFVRQDGRYGFLSARSLRSVVARWAATRGTMPRLAAAVRSACDEAFLDAWVVTFVRPREALPVLRRLEEVQTGAVARLGRILLCEPFDEAWLLGLPDDLRSHLVDRTIVEAERIGFRTGALFAFLCRDPRRWVPSHSSLSALAGLAVLRGDVAALGVLGGVATDGPLGHSIPCALAMLEGRYADAAREAELTGAKLDKSLHMGVVALLQALALGRTRSLGAVATMRKLLALGKRKDAPFESAFKVLDFVLSLDASPRGPDPTRIPSLFKSPTDCVTRLFDSLAMTSVEVAAVDAVWLYQQIGDHERHFSETGCAWLARQYHFATLKLQELVPKTFRRPALPEAPVGPSIFDALVARQPWEIALDRLEALAALPGPSAGADAASSERLFWRTVGSSPHPTVEPYVQKRAAGTGQWTSGRKLAIKHLLGDGGFTKSLPTEDQRVAEHAHAERTYSYGYGETLYTMRASAWVALVGHPRVFIGSAEMPTEVVLGVPKITVRSQSDGLRVATAPPGLRPGVQVHEEGGRLVVYSTPPERAGLLAAIGAGLTFPASARSQCLAALDRLAHLMPIDSTEESAARLVPSDPKPYFRLVPSQNGLSVTLFVRPLGASGPHCEPTKGAPMLVGSIAGETVRTERDFAAEERAATDALVLLPALAASDTGDFTWVLGAPEESLEVVSSLRALGDRVTVEWPHGTPLRLRARLGRSALRGGIRRDGGWLDVDARLAVDADLAVGLEEILKLLSESPGRFLRLGDGEYVELEAELREALEAVAVARTERKNGRGVSLPLGAVSVLRQLDAEGGGLSLDDSARAWRDKLASAFDRRAVVPRKLQGFLRDYQLEGFRWLARLSELELGACLADDMGLGKTIQLIALLLLRAKAGPALIVAPTSVCDNWRREIERFAPSLRIGQYWGSERAGVLRQMRGRDVVLTSYAILVEDAEALAGVEWATAILDEAQLIKNAETQRARAAFGLSAKMRIAATGTPIENHAGDLHSIFRFLHPGLLGSPQQFGARMGASQANGHRAVRSLIAPFVLRRTKAEVLDDLPPLTEIQHTVTLSPPEAALYEAVRKAALSKLGGATSEPGARIQVLAELTRLRRLCCHPELVAPGSNLRSSKLESFLELARELVDGGHRMLVFSQFTDVLAHARALLDANEITYQYLDGSTPQKQRGALVDAFQAGVGDAFLISLKAGGFGLNLTGADYVIHLDPWWNPAVESQASDRAHRIGQTRPVTVYRLVTEGTIEARIVELHREKKELAESILEGSDRAAKLSSEDLRSLLEGSLGIERDPDSAPLAPRTDASQEKTPRSPRTLREPRLSLEQYAQIVAKLSQGEKRAEVLRSARLTEASFEPIQQAWALSLKEDRALATRFVALLSARS